MAAIAPIGIAEGVRGLILQASRGQAGMAVIGTAEAEMIDRRLLVAFHNSL